MRFGPGVPEGAIGGDLVWWRGGEHRTTVTVHWDGDDVATPIDLVLRWFDGGRCRYEHRQTIEPGGCAIVTASDPVPEAASIGDGVLAMFAVPHDPRLGRRERLYPVVDWRTPEGGLITLHSDHCLLDAPAPIELTEIAFDPSTAGPVELVFLADGRAEPSDVVVTFTNHLGEQRHGVVQMTPAAWCVERVDIASVLATLTDDPAAFADGDEVAVDGRRSAVSLFERPYVVLGGSRPGGYHGGDRYDWAGLPRAHHVLLGEGEVNPMLVVVDETLGIDTTVTFFHTHGSLTDPFAVSVRVYGLDGALVAHEPRWRVVEHGRPVTADFREVLASHTSFRGHAAFTFGQTGRAEYPGHLQALLRYVATSSTARVMAWSDEWNTAARTWKRMRHGGTYRSFMRAVGADSVDWLAITNAGSADHRTTATCRITVSNSLGDATVEHCVAAHATLLAPLRELVPSARSLLDAPAAVLVDSEHDLAMVALTASRSGESWAVEHLMSATTWSSSGAALQPAGS
jgi:hypothetical protein